MRGLAVGLFVAILSFATLLLSASLYAIRRFNRAWYGIIEVVVTLFTAAIFLMNVIKRGDPHFVFPDSINWIPGLQDSLTFAVAIYLGVRALDNIGEGLKPATGCREKWDDVFPKRG
jgi:hypothetical protein